jgi:hypothetical protein
LVWHASSVSDFRIRQRTSANRHQLPRKPTVRAHQSEIGEEYFYLP